MNLKRDLSMEDDPFTVTAEVAGEAVRSELVGKARAVRDYEVPFPDGWPAEVTVRRRYGAVRARYQREIGGGIERPLRLNTDASTPPEEAFPEGDPAVYVFHAPQSRVPFTLTVSLSPDGFDAAEEMPAVAEHFTPLADPTPAIQVGDRLCVTTTTTGNQTERSLPVQVEGTVVSLRDYRADHLPVEAASHQFTTLFEATLDPADEEKAADGYYRIYLDADGDAIEADVPEDFNRASAAQTPVDIDPGPPFPPSALQRRIEWHGQYGHTTSAAIRHIEVQNRDAREIADWFEANPDAPSTAAEARGLEESEGPPSVEQIGPFRDWLQRVFEGEPADWFSIVGSPAAVAKAIHAVEAGEEYPGGPPTMRVRYESAYTGTEKEVEGDVLGVTLHTSRHEDDKSIEEAPRLSLSFGSRTADDRHRLRLDTAGGESRHLARPSSGAGLGRVLEAELTLGAHDLRALPDPDTDADEK
jgi:hypothetical protein